MRELFESRVVLVALVSISTAVAFQPASIIGPRQVCPLSSSSELPMSLWLAEDIVTTETYNAMNGVMGDVQESTTATMSDLLTDPSVALAATVATVALIGLAATQAPAAEPETTKATGTSSSSPKSTNVITPTAPSKTSSAKEESPEIVIPLPDNADVSVEERAALEAFDKGSRSGILSSIGKLAALVRSTRRELSTQSELREDAEEKLTMVAEEMRDLEDKYELEQNTLQKTARDLKVTRVELEQTQEQLRVKSETLQTLEDERKSLRKLGRQAWRLSKSRMQNRVEKIRSRFGKEEDKKEGE